MPNMVDFKVQCSPAEELLPALDDQSIDVIFIDPLYNTKNNKDKTVDYDRNQDFKRKNWKNFHATWDNVDKYYAWTLHYARIARRKLKPKGSIFACGSFHNIPEMALAFKKAGYYTIQWVQWCIPNAFPNIQCTKNTNANQTIIWARPFEETTQYYDKEAAKRYNDGVNLKDYWIIPKESTRKTPDKPWLNHPSKKPVALMERAIDITLPKVNGGVVLDFFAGSGATGESVEKLARRYNLELTCILGDKSSEYVEWIKARVDYLGRGQ